MGCASTRPSEPRPAPPAAPEIAPHEIVVPPAKEASDAKEECIAPASRTGSITTARVDAETKGLSCCAYLRTSGSRATHLAYVQSGTGIYTTADADVGGLAPLALSSKSFALLTIDKPGIGMDAKGRVTLVRDRYKQHTLADLVTCSRNAIAWATTRDAMAGDARIVVNGHSEGAQSLVRLLDSRDALLDRVEVAILSGMPMEPMLHAVERQLAIFMPFEIEPFQRALERRDDEYLVDLGLPARYLEHPTARQGMESVLSDLAEKRPRLRVELFHGERDLNAPIALVKKFVQANERAKSAGRPALDLRLHVYPRARHDLDAYAQADLAALLGSL